VNGPFDGILSRNSYRQPGLYFQDTALLKNIPLPREGMQLQFRAEFYNLFNHPNLYVNGGSTDVNAQPFTSSVGQSIPGVTASYHDNRQIVLALKWIF
jgi:hypothetical protein